MADEVKKGGSWKDRHDILKIIKIQDERFGWLHVIIGKRKKDGEKVIRLKRFRNWFTIPSDAYFSVFKKALELGAQELEWSGQITDENLKKLIAANEDLQKLKEKKRGHIKRQKEVINQLLEQVGKLREEQLSINLDSFKKDIKEFSKKLNDNAKEKDLQNWLFDHTWIFGLNYIDASKEVINREGDRIDFLLQRYDTFYDIIELKLPASSLFQGESGNTPQIDISRKFQISTEVKNAISQVIGYLEEYEIDKTNIHWKKGISIHKPRGIIVIGRSDKQIKRALKTLNSYLHDIEILTYDDMLEFGKNFISIIEKKGLNK